MQIAPTPAGSSRRQFVRQFALGTVTTIVGRPWIATLLVSLVTPNRAAAAPTDGVIALRLADFPPLLQDLGSVRVSVNPLGGSYPSGDFYPVIVTRSGSTFYAVSSACTHRGCVVQPFNGTSIVCPCHGSEFWLDGTVTQSPATTNLTTYPVSLDGETTLKITIPGLGYSITGYILIDGPTPRVQLEFPTFTQVDYEVRFRQSATSPWAVVAFATTPTGPADSQVLTGDGTAKTVYVDRTTPTGFYCVAIIVREV